MTGDLVDFYRKIFQESDWPPDVVLSMPPSFWHALAGGGDPAKLDFATFEEMQKYVDEVLTPSQTPEAETQKARRELRFELDWYKHDGI